MLTICIPVFNFDATLLVKELLFQVEQIPENCQILIIDDASEEKFKTILRGNKNPKLTYIELPENVGRAAIRNKFTEFATTEFLLFLDCDSIIHSKKFIKNYISYLKNNSEDVVVGGRVYPENCPTKDNNLRWKYGVKRESKSAKKRSLRPNSSFMTNNFVIKREILEKIRFDESLKLYGHEDTLYGIVLKKNGIKIQHIENPILNGDIETNKVFLEKTKLAIFSLISLLNKKEFSNELYEEIKLLRAYKTLTHFKIDGIFSFTFKIIEKGLYYFLTKIPSLFLLDIYKLGILSSNLKK